MTLAGLVIVAFFSLFPALPTARTLLRESVVKHLFCAADTYLLTSVRGASHKFELPEGLDKAILQKQTESLAVSSASHDYAGVTIFEPSPRGKFPLGTWNRLLTLLDNFNTALAVSNGLFTRLTASSTPHDNSAVERIGNSISDDRVVRVTASSLLAMANALNTWQPLPPLLTSPIQTHLSINKQLHEIGNALRRNEIVETPRNPDMITYFYAHQIASAILSKYLEDSLECCGELVGVSGFKTYLTAHQKGV